MLRYHQAVATPSSLPSGASSSRDAAGSAVSIARLTSNPSQRAMLAARLPSAHQSYRQGVVSEKSAFPYRDTRSPAASVESTDRESSPTPSANSTQSSRSTHSAVTASYTWPRFQPFFEQSAKSSPVLFVEYRTNSSLQQVEAMSSIRESGASSRPALLRHGRGPRNESSSPYPSLSAVTSAPPSSSQDNLPQYTRPPARRPSGDSFAPVAVAPSRSLTPPGDRDFQHTLRHLDLGGRRRRRPGGPPSLPYSSESESSSGKSSKLQGTIGAARHSSSDPDVDDWMRHARALDGEGSAASFTCTWVDPNGGLLRSECGYTSKKHLVKRHIESKHLQIKPITCEICGKGFSQRTNYSTHMNTHTGDTPHKCPYPNCNATFGDPARRHRHMKSVHNHIPSKRKTQADQNDADMMNYVSEPEEEDSA